jgi:hypothetical protein
MNTSYAYETIAQQRLDQAARLARTAHQLQPDRPRPRRWSFPKVSFPTRRHTFTPRPA